jgi:glycosyltransferase involved in cell wall biosynthesis
MMRSEKDDHTGVSVVICTHNPRREYFTRVLEALKNQSLPYDRWELLLIDNTSTPPVMPGFDLSWHPHSRYIVEAELGLTPARLRGISETSGALIVFVDDDNVLAHDYLEVALEIAAQCPHIGAFGGSVKGEFEMPPAPWTRPYVEMLAVRELQRDTWSNLLSWNDGTPVGAGLCVRRSVAEDYKSKALTNNRRRALGRVGTGTGCAEDTDLSYCAIDLGMGIGTFCRLKLTHLIPKQRLTLDYFCRLSAGATGSALVLQSFRGLSASRSKHQQLMDLARFMGKVLLSSKADRRMEFAAQSGRRRAQQFLRKSVVDKRLLQQS